MKSFIVFALFVAAAVALPLDDPKNAVIQEQSQDNIGTGSYGFKWRTSDGKTAEEEGTLKNVGQENEATEVRGSYSFIGLDGVTYAVTYVANEFGFQPQGAHLPKNPQ